MRKTVYSNVSNSLEMPPKKRAQRMGARPFIKRKDLPVICLVTIIMLSIVLSCALVRKGVRVGASQLANSFSSAYDSENENAFQLLYQAAFAHAEMEHHVSNRVQISIGNLEETQRLEILKANDIEIITEDRDTSTGNVVAWLEVEGEGTFVVDLQAAEFIVDNERQYVLVRIPNPELANIGVIQTTRRLFSDDLLNGSYRQGVDLAVKQRNEAIIRIEKALLSNPYTYDTAKKVAVSMIRNLVVQFNPDVPQLQVDVEFFEG